MIRAQRVRSFNPTSARHLRTKARDTGAIPIAEFSGSVFQCFGPWADGACCNNPRATSQRSRRFCRRFRIGWLFHTINQARPLSVQSLMLFRPLADNATIIWCHRCSRQSKGLRAYAIATLAFAFERPQSIDSESAAKIVATAVTSP